VPYFFYKKEGKTHEVWFENEESVAEKIKIAKKAGKIWKKFGALEYYELSTFKKFLTTKN